MEERFDDIERELNTDKENTEEFSKGADIHEDHQGNKESIEDSEKELEKEAKADEGQEKGPHEEGQNTEEKEERAYGSEAVSSSFATQGASTTYEPPYYVPRVTYAGMGADGTAPKKKEKRTAGAWIIAVCLVLSIAIATCVGAFAGYFAVYSLGGISENGTTDSGTIIKNDGRVEVNKVVETGDYPAMDVASVAAAVKDSVVEISTSSIQTHPYIGQYVTSGAGSGVIILQTESTRVGYIVTNYHVVGGASEITVRLTNGNEYEATYRAGDEAMDIAVIEIKAQETLVCAEIGNSDKLAVGDEVIAIGNPLGELGGTVTNGIISALEREIIVDDNAMVLLQTNAEINPGNSGGGLFDMGGKLIGIVNAKQSSEGIEGLGFAIPINRIEQAIEDILSEDGYVKNRPTLGVAVAYTSTAYYREGIYVVEKKQDSALNVGDRILAINETEITSTLDYNIIVSSLEIGSEAKISVARNGQIINITVTVTEDTSV